MLRTLVLLLIAAAAFAQTPKTNVQSGKRYPRIVIRGAIVVDGSGTPRSRDAAPRYGETQDHADTGSADQNSFVSACPSADSNVRAPE